MRGQRELFVTVAVDEPVKCFLAGLAACGNLLQLVEAG
jgi:hypothetical protein